MGVFIICLLVTSLIFIFMEYIQNARIYNANDVFFVENTYMSYKDNFGLIFIFSCGLAVIAFIINTLLKVSKKTSKTTYQPNKLFVNENVQPNNIIKNNDSKYAIIPDKTNIIILEDVDKLTSSKMLEVMENVKYFSNYDNCITILPFDEELLAKAIIERNENKLNENDRAIQFEKIFDKLFQFKIYVPRIANENIKDYAVELANEKVSSFIEEYCEQEILNKVIRNVLIYKDVVTPRHVKKLINNFINNKILITLKVQNNKIDESVLNCNNFDFKLAKISVIQSDFPEFYNAIFKDFEYMELLTNLYELNAEELRNTFEQIDEDLKPFFTRKYRPLRNFLKQTRKIEFDNLPLLMYLTTVKTEIMFKDKKLCDYISGEEDISALRIQEVLELVKLIVNKEDLKDFTTNNFSKLLDGYKTKCENKIYFINLKEIVNIIIDYIDEKEYLEFLKIAAENYNYYPEEALEMFNNTKIEIPVNVMDVLFERIKQTISKDNYGRIFEFLRDNCDPFFEEEGNVSDYVQFLVNYIGLSSNPTDVIQELDDNFTRIGKIYELNKNIKGLENLNTEIAFNFLAKCINNGDLTKAISTFNKILSDEDSVESCLKIEEKTLVYKIKDVIESNVDDILTGKFQGNSILLKNLIDIASYKQGELDPTDVMKIVETALESGDEEKILNIYEVLNKYDRMYFYEIRRDFNEIIYKSFHVATDKKIKKAALDCTRYFKNTRLFKTKLDKNEEKFYESN